MLKRRLNYNSSSRISLKRHLVIIVNKVLLPILYYSNITTSITKFLMESRYLSLTAYILYYLYF
jgi:hypothetical protein